MRSHRDAVRAVAAGEFKLRGQRLFVHWWLDSPRLSVLNVPASCRDEEYGEFSARGERWVLDQQLYQSSAILTAT